MTMQPADFPRIAIRCKNPQCRDRGRVLAETDGARLEIIGGGYIDVSVPVRCPTCESVQKWVPDTTLYDRAYLLTMALS